MEMADVAAVEKEGAPPAELVSSSRMEVDAHAGSAEDWPAGTAAAAAATLTVKVQPDAFVRFAAHNFLYEEEDRTTTATTMRGCRWSSFRWSSSSQFVMTMTVGQQAGWMSTRAKVI
jgi:hypothetical protein